MIQRKDDYEEEEIDDYYQDDFVKNHLKNRINEVGDNDVNISVSQGINLSECLNQTYDKFDFKP